MKKVELHLLVRGRVQGVGFRATVYHLASRLDITGTVRNLFDESVEIYAQAQRPLLDQFLKELKLQPGGALITQMDAQFSAPSRRLQGFEILP